MDRRVAMLALYVDSVGESFTDAGSLSRRLVELDRTTLVRDATLSDLTLRADGSTVGGWRLSQTAFRDVCGELSDGLFRAAADLAGAVRAPEDPLDQYSLSDAVKLYNSVLTRRYESRIADKFRVLLRPGAGVLDAIEPIGRPESSLVDVYDRAVELLTNAAGCFELVDGLLSGRRLTLRYVDRRVVVLDRERRRWRFGAWVRGGDCSAIHVADIVCCDVAASLGPPRRVNADAGFSSVLTDRDVVAAFRKLTRTSAVPADGDSRRSKRVKQAITKLRNLGAPADVSRRAVGLASRPAVFVVADVESGEGVQRDGSATWFDVYVSLGRLASRLDFKGREQVEFAAHALAFGDDD